MDILKLRKLEEQKKAMVVDSCMEGTVQLWEVPDDQKIEGYVAKNKAKQITFDQAIEMIKGYQKNDNK